MNLPTVPEGFPVQAEKGDANRSDVRPLDVLDREGFEAGALVCVRPLSYGSQDGLTCAREIEYMPVKGKGEKAEEASDFGTGRRQDWAQRGSDECSLRKCQPGGRRFLKPRAPVEGAHVWQGRACRRPPATLSIRWAQPVWLSWVRGQQPEW